MKVVLPAGEFADLATRRLPAAANGDDIARVPRQQDLHNDIARLLPGLVAWAIFYAICFIGDLTSSRHGVVPSTTIARKSP